MKVITPGHRYQLPNFEPPPNLHAESPRGEIPVPGSLAEGLANLCKAIEALPASEQQTAVSLAASVLAHRALYGDQEIQFIEKQQLPPNLVPGSTAMTTVHNGTTNEAVLDVLIDRLQHLNGKFPCRENTLALTNLEQAQMWLEKRTKNRQARGVEGKAVA